MCLEVIGWEAHFLPGLKLSQMLHKQVRLQAVGVVKVRFGSFFDRLVGLVPVIMIMCQVNNISFCTQLLEDTAGECSLVFQKRRTLCTHS